MFASFPILLVILCQIFLGELYMATHNLHLNRGCIEGSIESRLRLSNSNCGNFSSGGGWRTPDGEQLIFLHYFAFGFRRKNVEKPSTPLPLQVCRALQSVLWAMVKYSIVNIHANFILLASTRSLGTLTYLYLRIYAVYVPI